MIAIKTLELLVLCDRLFCNALAKEHEHIYSNVVEEFNELLQKNYTKERSVRFYADALHTHPNNLNFLVKKYTGSTAKETIADYIILEAKYLLHATALTVKEIAYELGFDDPNYFSAFFRKKVNLSPLQYRLQPV
jgi:AraC-like DNA-binding protein